jgi:hypothetical protein
VTDPSHLDRLLSPPVRPLSPPPGLYRQLRRRAARRRRARAALATAGTSVAVALVVAAAVPVALRLAPAPAPPPAAGPSDPSPVSPSASRTPSHTPSHDGSPERPATVRRCHVGTLRASLGRTEPAAGNRYATLVLTNTGTRPCAMTGRPALRALTADQRPLGPVASYAAGNPRRRLVLSSGASASTVVHWAADAAGPCRPTSTYLRVRLPGGRAAVTVPAHVQLCGDVFDVRNLTDGATGMSG